MPTPPLFGEQKLPGKVCHKPISQAPNHTTQMPQDISKGTRRKAFPELAVPRHVAETKENRLWKNAPSSEASKNSHNLFSKENEQLRVNIETPTRKQGLKDKQHLQETKDTDQRVHGAAKPTTREIPG